MNTGDLPNFFILGAPKCGTTSLHAALRQAPHCFMSQVKEPGFFHSSTAYDLGLDYYSTSFFKNSSSFHVRGESTPWYLYSEEAPKRIARDIPDVRLLVVLCRPPAARAFSMYLDQVGIGSETRSFEDAVEEEVELLSRGNSYPVLERRYLEHGLYTRFIDTWAHLFPSVKIAVLPAVGLASSAQIWDRIAEGLDVDLGPELLTTLPTADRNPSGRLRFSSAFAALSRTGARFPRARSALRRHIPAGLDHRVIQTLRRAAMVPTAQPPSMPAAIETYLNKFFADSIHELGIRHGLEF